jgi:hypothetical protein
VEDLKFETRPPWSISKKKVNVNTFQQIKLDQSILDHFETLGKEMDDIKQGLRPLEEFEQRKEMELMQLTRGDFIGARTLVPFEIYKIMKQHGYGEGSLTKHYPWGCRKAEKSRIDEMPLEQYWHQSLVNVRADSRQVDVWIINKNDLTFLPDKIIKEVFLDIVKLKESDRPYLPGDVNFIVQQFGKWDDFKESYCRQVLENKRQRVQEQLKMQRRQ